MSCRFVLPFSGRRVRRSVRREAGFRRHRQANRETSCGLGAPIPPDGKMPSEAGGGKTPNPRTPYPELVCTLLWTSGLVF